MKKIFRKFLALTDVDFLLNTTAQLTAIELGQTFPCYLKSAQLAERIMLELGLEEVQRIPFPADGKTVYHDVVMPLAWDASVGKLTISHLPCTPLDASDIETENVTVADFQCHSFHLVKGSSALPAGGIQVPILSESQLLEGEDPRGVLVMLDALTTPGGAVLKSLLDYGALGFITDCLRDRYLTPEGIPWVNGCTEGKHWHVIRGDRPFVGFAVSPRMGDRIRSGTKQEPLLAQVECDGRLYEDTLPVLTGIIPGRRKEELWLTAHLYEPLSTDNSAGVATVIETMRLIREQGHPEFTIRCVFAMELYGFSAYVSSLGSNLSRKVIASINCDSLIPVKGDPLVFKTIGAAVPFYGRFLVQKLREELRGDSVCLRTVDGSNSSYSDDAFVNDPMIGVPTLWPGGNRKLWHNSKLTMEAIDRDVFHRCAAFFATCAHLLSSPPADTPEESLRLAVEHLHSLKKNRASTIELTADFLDYHFCQACATLEACLKWTGREECIPQFLKTLDQEYQSLKLGLAHATPQSLWRDRARSIIPKRLGGGFVHDGVKFPPRKMPFGFLGHVLIAWIDGKRNFADVVRMSEYELGHLFNDNEIKEMVYKLYEQIEAGYLNLSNPVELSGAEVSAALKRVGVQKGNLLLVHTTASSCSHVQGGATTIIKALREAVGENGTILFPNFASCFIMPGEHMESGSYHPFDASDPDPICSQKLSKALLHDFPEAVWSRHSTDSWVGFGSLAKEYLERQESNEMPASENSLMAFALRNGGKILHYGFAPDFTVFLHYLEKRFHLPYLTSARCREQDKITGCRDFYLGINTLECKFFSRAIAEGLEINRESLGLDALCLVDMKQLFTVGKQVILKDPKIFLCDQEKCFFCSHWKSVIRKTFFHPHE